MSESRGCPSFKTTEGEVPLKAGSAIAIPAMAGQRRRWGSDQSKADNHLHFPKGKQIDEKACL